MIYIMNGYPESGKTTFEQMVKTLMGRHCRGLFSIIDPIKEAAAALGWRNDKDPEGRKFLSDLKDLSTEYNNFPIRDIIARVSCAMISAEENDCCFIDCREPSEIFYLTEQLDAKAVLIYRLEAPSIISNHADSNVENYKYDIYINNTTTIDDLWKTADDFITTEGLNRDPAAQIPLMI